MDWSDRQKRRRVQRVVKDQLIELNRIPDSFHIANNCLDGIQISRKTRHLGETTGVHEKSGVNN